MRPNQAWPSQADSFRQAPLDRTYSELFDNLSPRRMAPMEKSGGRESEGECGEGDGSPGWWQQELRLAEEIHRAGICVRHLGYVRKHVKMEGMKRLLLSEMVARVSKNMIRGALREKMAEVKLPSSQVIDCLHYLHSVLSSDGAAIACREYSAK